MPSSFPLGPGPPALLVRCPFPKGNCHGWFPCGAVVQPGSRLLLISAASAVFSQPSDCARWLLISAASSAAPLFLAAVCLGTGLGPSPLFLPALLPICPCEGGLNSEDPGVADSCSFSLSSPPHLVSPPVFLEFVFVLPPGLVFGRLGRFAGRACLGRLGWGPAY